MNTEEILWQSIKDIETGVAKTTKEDPIDGWLDDKSRRGLTKINVCAQSAKYTNNNKSITRPTLDSYPSIVDYISGKSKKQKKKLDSELKNKLKEARELNNILKDSLEKIAEENYELKEKIRILENKLKNNIKIIE